MPKGSATNNATLRLLLTYSAYLRDVHFYKPRISWELIFAKAPFTKISQE